LLATLPSSTYAGGSGASVRTQSRRPEPGHAALPSGFLLAPGAHILAGMGDSSCAGPIGGRPPIGLSNASFLRKSGGTSRALRFEMRQNGAVVIEPRRRRDQTDAEREAGLANLAGQQEQGSSKGTGYMSPATRSAVKKCAGSMLALAAVPAAKLSKQNEDLGYLQQRCYLTFLTVILPSEQHKTVVGEYDDKAFKRLLGRFIEELQRVYGVECYLWVIEPQENGNAHAHILIDKYIENLPEGQLKADSVPLRLTKTWNRLLRRAGYIEPYAEQQRAKYAGGFQFDINQTQVRREWNGSEWVKVVEVVSKQVQQKRWAYGVSTNWQEPNTVDIHALYKAENVAGYIAAYMTKSEGVRPVSGRLWGHSAGLEKVGLYQEEYSDELRAPVTALVKNGKARVLLVTAEGLLTPQEYEDNELHAAGVAVLATVYSWKAADWWAVAPAGYVRRYRNHWREQFRRMYERPSALPAPELRVGKAGQVPTSC
jgi:hypothetical protein